jgi:hypothetical protein
MMRKWLLVLLIMVVPMKLTDGFGGMWSERLEMEK